MIYYKTNSNWFGVMFHLARSRTMVWIMRAVLLVGLYTTILYLAIDYLDLERAVRMNSSVGSLLGIILSIFLVFRTNSAYDRWWEARKHWGALVNNTRNLAIYVDSVFPESNQEVRRFMAKHIANFCLALVEHLREGVKLENLIYLNDQDLAEYRHKGHIPNHIALQIYRRLAAAHREGEINEGDYINIKAQHQALLDILGACERIKKTPIPFSYAAYLKIFITAYGIMLPWALLNRFDLWTIPLTMFIFFTLIGVELLGEEIEDPFGLDCNDLPTGDIAETIRKDVYEILEDRFIPVHDKQKEWYEKVL